jgi:5S rRNA maturation endonuclease (ribonuclease M5)
LCWWKEKRIRGPLLDLLTHLKMGTGPFKKRGKTRLVIIMTDWDRKGGHLASNLVDYCRSIDLAYDLEFRKRIAVLLGRWVKDVEAVAAVFEGLKRGRIKL